MVNSKITFTDDFARLRNVLSKTSVDLEDTQADRITRKEEICIFHLESKCRYKDKCPKLHTTLPYQWQFYDEGTQIWVPFAENINWDIEKVFCDPVYDVLPFYFGEQV